MQFSTDANGLYKIPTIPPRVYKVSTSQNGFVQSEARVTVGEGVPVTTQNFVLVSAKPITINGKVST